ncbi:hypothetical protein M422DRAFT_153616 [Sphaerobolus stellatus SS14]|nr:hypothetical protein M422DRAFT_153616 [Sphaerobolus stellatus SS14]
MSSQTPLQAQIQVLIDNAVEKKVAPGLQCVVFAGDQTLFNGVSGYATIPTASDPNGSAMTQNNILWVASCTKLVTCLVVLHIVDRGVAKNFTLDDIDNHEKLVEVLPEFKHGSGSILTKILEGFEDELGPDGKKVMKLRDAKGKVTLRMLLTHSAGLGFGWNNPLLAELYTPSDGSKPHKSLPFDGGLDDFVVPLVHEPGEGYHYGFATDWLGQFAVRSTGKNLRVLFKEFIFEPLGISPADADLYIPPSLQSYRATVHRRDPSSPIGFKLNPFSTYTAEVLDEGKTYVAESGLHCTLQGYARILQAAVTRDERIMSKETWEKSFKDDFAARGLKVTVPDLPSIALDFVDVFAKSDFPNAVGMNWLQCKVATAPAIGSFAWAGLPNVYYFADPTNRVGAIIGAQLMPFYDTEVIQLRDNLETLIYNALPSLIA